MPESSFDPMEPGFAAFLATCTTEEEINRACEVAAQRHLDNLINLGAMKLDSYNIALLADIAARLAAHDAVEDAAVRTRLDHQLLLGLTLASDVPDEFTEMFQLYRGTGPLTPDDMDAAAELKVKTEDAAKKQEIIADELGGLMADILPSGFVMTDDVHAFLISLVQDCFVLRYLVEGIDRERIRGGLIEDYRSTAPRVSSDPNVACLVVEFLNRMGLSDG